MTPTRECERDVPRPGRLEQFQQLDTRLADIQIGIAEIRAIYTEYQRRLERLERTLYGNGLTGLCTKVSAILWVVSGVAGFTVLLAAQTIAAMFGARG